MTDFSLFRPMMCGFEYDEELVWPEDGIEPGTRWVDMPMTGAARTAARPRPTSR